MNKELEKEILAKVYPSKYFEVAEKGEESDFIIRRLKSKEHFGVEITELFKDETTARLIKIPDYSKNLLNKQEYKHKDDKKNITIDTIKIFDETGKIKLETLALIQQIPSVPDYLNIFLERLKIKESKLTNYLNNSITHVNLIIQDQENFFNAINLESFYSTFFTNEIVLGIKNSKFREIYLVTRINEKEYYAYLKTFWLCGEFHLFHEFFTKHGYDLPNNQSFVELFLKYCSDIGIEDIHYRKSEAGLLLFYGDLLIFYNQDMINFGRSYDIEYLKLPNYKQLLGSINASAEHLQAFLEFKKGKVIQSKWLEQLEEKRGLSAS
jgi:hypothetical protein